MEFVGELGVAMLGGLSELAAGLANELAGDMLLPVLLLPQLLVGVTQLDPPKLL